MIGFDVETTATDPTEARIVTAALAKCGGGDGTETESWMADPGVEISEEAAGIHGITTEKARAEGLPPAAVIPEVIEELAAARQLGYPVVIFNAPYDLTVLDREARRHDIEPLSLDGLYVIDPLVMDKWLDRFRKGSRKLEAICKCYGATLDAAHDADSDALAACRAAWVLGAKGRVIRQIRHWGGHAASDREELLALEEEWFRVRGDLPALHEAQARWYFDQASGLADYFRDQQRQGIEPKGDPDKVTTTWPIIPAPAQQALAA